MFPLFKTDSLQFFNQRTEVVEIFFEKELLFLFSWWLLERET